MEGGDLSEKWTVVLRIERENDRFSQDACELTGRTQDLPCLARTVIATARLKSFPTVAWVMMLLWSKVGSMS